MFDGELSVSALHEAAEDYGWRLFDEDRFSATYGTDDNSLIFVVERDRKYHDHACWATWIPHDLGSATLRCLQADELHGLIVDAVERDVGEPARKGVWPSTPYDVYHFGFRFAIWQPRGRLIVVQQDDTDPQSGIEINICIQDWKPSCPLPTDRRWRYNEPPTAPPPPAMWPRWRRPPWKRPQGK